MEHHFRLGPPLLGAGDHILPDTWRDSLLRALNGSSRTLMAVASRAALARMLAESPRGTLRLTVARGVPEDSRLVTRFLLAAEQLQHRGGQHSTLVLCQDGDLQQEWWQAPLAALAQRPAPAPAPDHLQLDLQHIPATLLAHLELGFPGITSLELGTAGESQLSGVQLPEPAALPSVRQCAVWRVHLDAAPELWASLGPFLPQLHTLTISDKADLPESAQQQMCSALFSEATRTQTLTRLTLPCALGPWLTALLQQNAPSVQELAVDYVSDAVEGAADVAPHCSWRTLTSGRGFCFPQSAWQWLPVPAQDQDKLTISFQEAHGLPIDGLYEENSGFIKLPLPITETVAHKITRVTFQGYDKLMLVAKHVPTHNQPAALQAALPHIEPLRQPQHDLPQLVLHSFTMSAELAAEMANLQGQGWPDLAMDILTWPEGVTLTTPLPPLVYLGLASHHVLDDVLLAKLLACITHMSYMLYVSQVTLSTELPEGVDVPFSAIHVYLTDTEELIRSATVLGPGVRWECKKLYMEMSSEQLSQLQRLARRLRRVHLTALELVRLDPSQINALNELQLLRAGLILLRALPCRPKALSLADWRASEQVITELGSLATTLQDKLSRLESIFFYLNGLPVAAEMSEKEDDLSEGELEEGEIRVRKGNVGDDGVLEEGEWEPIARLPALVQSLPASDWHLHAPDLSVREVEALVHSAASIRTADRPLTIWVRGVSSAWAADMNAELERTGPYPHVTVEAHSGVGGVDSDEE